MATFVIDIDGTICSDTSGNYKRALPYSSRINYINNLFDLGHQIIYFTARGMGTFKNDINNAQKKWELLTRSQLIEWGVKYHELRFGKPSANFYIDDKNVSLENFFNQPLI